MREIIVELIAALPVYRTYIAETAGPEDRELLATAAAKARRALTRGAKRALSTLVEILEAGGTDEEAATFIRRFQQLSGPAMAKGYEDTELYRRSVSLPSTRSAAISPAPSSRSTTSMPLPRRPRPVACIR